MVLITVLAYEAANEYGALEQFPDVDPATTTVTDIMRKIRESTKLHNPHVRIGMQLYTYVDRRVPGDLINDAENDPLALTATLDEFRLSGRLQFEEDRRGMHLKVLVDGCRTAEEASEFKLKQSWRTEVAALRCLRKKKRDLTARLDLQAEPQGSEVLGTPLQRLSTPRLASQAAVQAVAAHPTRRADYVRRIWPYWYGSIRIVVMSVGVIVILAVVVGYYHNSPDQLNNCGLHDCNRLSPIHQAAITGQTDKMRSLIKQYLTDLPTKPTDGEKKSQEMPSEAAISYTDSVKHLAAKYDRTETVRALTKEFGMDVNEKNKDGNTPLHEASFHGDTVRVLIKELGADVNEKHNHVHTPLHLASMRGRTGIVRVLIKAFGMKRKYDSARLNPRPR